MSVSDSKAGIGYRQHSIQQGETRAYAFLCHGSMYSRPRWSKMSFSVVAARNSF